MKNIRGLVHHAARSAVQTFTGTRLAQESTQASGQAHAAPYMAATARKAAAEGCVLLENNGVLPLIPSESVAVFGRCQIDWVSMGKGSGGDVHASYLTNLIDGLDGINASYNRVLAEMYRAWCSDPAHARDEGFWGRWPQSLPEMPVSRDLARAAAAECKTAIVVIGRSAGEDQDLAPKPGGYYLSDDEHQLLAAATATFENVVVVVDACNIIDFSWIDLYREGISAVLLAWPGGMEAGNAVADVLYGRVNPSGRLTSAVARTLDEHPSSKTFGRPRTQQYPEGVFIGYRHFCTYAPREMRYPLGHGLSYTSFSCEPLALRREHTHASLDVRITNTGERAGREVVIVWCEPPRGFIDKPLLQVAAFAKTAELGPGESEELRIEVNLTDVATFDESRRAFVLEEGIYCLRANKTMVGKTIIGSDILFGQLAPICGEGLRERIEARLKKPAPVDELAGRLTPAELEALTRGAGNMSTPFGPAGNAGAFGGITPALQKRDIPPVVCADGPSGVRLAKRGSLLPCATALASTWDVALVEELYALLGVEANYASIDVLLAPGMNLQRSPLCGRNFEYFSEDPILSGYMACAVVRGLRRAGVQACPKHFACNNQERNRNNLDVRVDERTLRELYLRPFQICVREAKPKLIMTSYNKINGVWSHYSFDLATTVLRDEWGFDGVVITDWWMRKARSPEFPCLRDNAYRVRAGVNVLMPGNMGRVSKGYRVHRSLLETLGQPDGITRDELEQSASIVLAFVRAVKGWPR